MKRILYLLVLILLPNFVSANTYFARKNGTWSNGTFSATRGGSSCGCTPSASDIVIIPSPYTITKLSDLTIGSSGDIGTLTIESGGTLNMSSKNMEIQSGGIFYLYGTINNVQDVTFNTGTTVNSYVGSMFSIKGNFENWATNITLNGTVTIEGMFKNKQGAIISGTTGTISVKEGFTNSGSVYSGATCVSGDSDDAEEDDDESCTFRAKSPLPIELMSFSVKQNKAVIELDWVTATEQNNDYFTIERSKDAKTFENVSKVSGHGNSSSTIRYSCSDENPLGGISYYRLKQTDYNGNYTHSTIVSIEYNGNTDFSYSVYPDPTDGVNINLLISTEKGEEVLVAVYDVTGKESYSKTIVVEDNAKQIYSITPSRQLSQGIYLLMLTTNKKVYTKKLVVQ